MADQLAAVDRIARNPAAPTFENTIAEMERSSRMLDRVSTLEGVYQSTMSDDAMQAVEREMAPKLAEFGDKITQNEKLFARIAAVYDTREKSGLTPEQQRLTWLYYTTYVRQGAKLDAAAKKQMSELNQQLAGLYTSFGQNVLKDENDGVLVLEKESDLAGLPQSVRDGAAEEAAGRGLKGQWAVSNTRSSVEPFLTYSDRRDLRQKVWQMFVDRGDHGGPTDNNANVTKILQLRAQRAKLLGLPDACALAPRGLDGQDAGARHGADGGRVDAGGGPRARRSRRHAGDRRQGRRGRQDRALGLPLLRREGAQGEVRPRRDRDHAVPAAREAARRHVLHGEGAVRIQLQARGSEEGARVSPGRAGLGGHGSGRQAGRTLVLRPVCAQGQALGRVDERLPQPGALGRRREDHRVEQRQLREGQARRTGAGQLGRRDHAVPRIRPCAARAQLERDVSVALGHQRGARLRGVSVATARALALDAGDPQSLRAALPDRQADPARRWSTRSRAQRSSTRASRRSSISRAR